MSLGFVLSVAATLLNFVPIVGGAMWCFLMLPIVLLDPHINTTGPLQPSLHPHSRILIFLDRVLEGPSAVSIALSVRQLVQSGQSHPPALFSLFRCAGQLLVPLGSIAAHIFAWQAFEMTPGLAILKQIQPVL